MAETYLAPSLRDEGYTGVTGTTPYMPATEQQVASLQNLYYSPPTAGVAQTVSATATVINVNFDGTQNNGAFPATGESETNIYQLSKLQRSVGDPDNTLYLPGVGAQTLPSGTLDENGLPAAGSRPSNLDSVPLMAGKVANEILEDAYRQLSDRVSTILEANPNAEISLNLAGFSRGGAEAVAFANLLNERGIGNYQPGQVPVATLTLFDPVSMTDGALTTSWPSNVQNALVMVAMQEGRYIMPAMRVGENALIVPVEADHCGVGGSWNRDGTQAVTLNTAVDFQMRSGALPATTTIPEELRPNWSQMYIHNAGLDNYSNTKWSYSEGARIYEGARLGDPSVQQTLGYGTQSLPVISPPVDAFDYKIPANPSEPNGEQLTVREGLDAQGRPTLLVFDAEHRLVLSSHADDTLSQDPATGALSMQGDRGEFTVTQYYSEAASVRITTDQAGVVRERTELVYGTAGPATATVYDGIGNAIGYGTQTTYEDGSTSETITYTSGLVVRRNTDEDGNFSSRSVTEQTEYGSIQTTTYADGRTTSIRRDNDADGKFEQTETIVTSGDPGQYEIQSQQLDNAGDTGYSTMLLDADTGQVLGAVRVADAVLPENDLPDAASPSSTLSFTQAMFEAERFFAGDAHEIRSFVGLEVPLLGGDDTLSGDGSAVTTVWLREFDTFIGPQVIDDTLAELQADWSVGTDGSATQGTTGSDITDSPTLDIEGLYTLDLSWLNPAYGYNSVESPAFDLDLDFSYTYEAPKLVFWDFTQDTGFNYLASGSSIWDTGGDFNADLGSPYSNYDLFDSYSYDLFGLGSVLTFDLGGSDSFDLGGYSSGWDSGYSSGLGGGFSLDLGGGFDFSVGDYGPVVLDLDGDGIELVAAGDSRAWYDLDGHGARFHGMDDALLAIDDNGDGEISSGREIAFSLYTEADETDTDMEALATEFDTNADGRLDFNDERWADFRLWQDANGNGESDAGEVRTCRIGHRCATTKVSLRNTAANSSSTNRSAFKHAARAQGTARSGV